MNASELTRKHEAIRHLFTGFIEVLWLPGSSVALLVAISVFDAPNVYRSLIPAAGFIGFLYTPLTLIAIAHSFKPVGKVASAIFVASGVGLLLSIAIPNMHWYVLFVCLAHLILVQHVPLITQIYSNNFTAETRGKYAAQFFLISGVISALASPTIGWLLDENISFYAMVLAMGALACFGCAWSLQGVPSKPLETRHVGNIFHNLRLAWDDKLFGWMLSAWMLMGFGNLFTLPLRVIIMKDPVFGVNASNTQTLIITGAIPLLSRLLCTLYVGKLFDRWNLIHLRVTLNALFLSSILLFFTTTNLIVMGISSVFLGAAFSGGKLTWSLWVTKIAPEEKTSAYMSVHTFFTGIRGVGAPFLGVYLLSRYPQQTVSYAAAGLILISTLMFLPAARHIPIRDRENKERLEGRE